MVKVMTILMIILMAAILTSRIRRKPPEPEQPKHYNRCYGKRTKHRRKRPKGQTGRKHPKKKDRRQ